MNRMAMCSVVVALLGATGCKNTEPPARAPETPPAPTSSAAPPAPTSMQQTTPREGPSTLASSTTGVETTTQPSTPTSDRPTAGTAAPAMSDDQILYALHAANISEMEQARVAEKQAKNARVKRFASMMLKDHSEADAKGNEVAQKARASLTPSESSNRLETDAKQQMTAIAGQKGSEFDHAYIDGQVKAHRAVLDMIEREMLPSVQSPAVRELLQTVRPKVEAHLHEAQQIQKGLKHGF